MILMCAITGCANKEKPDLNMPWKPFGFEGLLEKVNFIIVEDSRNCGYHNLLTDEGRNSYDYGFDCVIESDELGVPFFIGTVRLPHDSYAYEVTIRDENSEYWFITYDKITWAENENQLWVDICKQAKFTLGVDEISDCRKIVGIDWEKGGSVVQ